MNRMISLAIGIGATTMLGASAFAAELVVDAKSAALGVYPTIQKAVDAAKPGDTVTVKGGTYGGFTVSKYYPDSPLTIRAASGERVIVSGFRKIEGWKEEGGGVYSAKVPSRANSLFLDYREQQCARWPENGTRLPVLKADSETRTFKTAPVDNPLLKEFAKDTKNAICFYYFAAANCFGSPAIESYDAKTGDIRFDAKNWSRWIKPDNNAYSFMNHPVFIRRPGTWAFVEDPGPVAKGKSRGGTLYFKPAAKDDLERTQYRTGDRPLVRVVHWKDRVGNVVIDGLELTGSANGAVQIAGDDVTLQNCIVHHNGGGVGARTVKNLKIRCNVVVANGGTGIGVSSVENGLIEGNEIAFHQIDGIVVAGNVSGKKTGTPGASLPTKHVVVRNNYHHHHYIQSHPDNIQMYRDVSDVVYENNFNIWGGQSLMSEETEDVVVRNNVVMGCSAVMLICGHGNTFRWKFEGNTLWGGGWGFFSFTGSDYEVSKTLMIGGSVPYGSPSKFPVKFHDNRYVPTFTAGTSSPWKKYTDLATVQTQFGQDLGSKAGPADVGNIPAFFACASANGDAVDSVRLRKDMAKLDFRPGDRIELNGDGRFRTVKSLTDGVLAFEPALKDPPFRGVMIFNWKDAKSTVVDAKPVDGCGANISTVGYQQGDLFGKGTRTLPVVPADVQAGMPDPNDLVIPPVGI